MVAQVLRFQKIKGSPDIASVFQHDTRDHVPDHADAKRTLQNIRLMGSEAGAGADYLAWKEMLPDKYRADAVVLGSVVVSGNADKINEMAGRKVKDGPHKGRSEAEAYLRDGLDWFKKKLGEENIVSAYIHNDEKSPHLHILWTPRYTNEKGQTRLSYKNLIGSQKYELSRWQDHFHEAVASKHGFDRGVVGSTSENKDRRKFEKQMRTEKGRAQIAKDLGLQEAMTKGYEEGQRLAREQVEKLWQPKVNALEKKVHDTENAWAAANRKLDLELRKEQNKTAQLEAELKQKEEQLKPFRPLMRLTPEDQKQVMLSVDQRIQGYEKGRKR